MTTRSILIPSTLLVAILAGCPKDNDTRLLEMARRHEGQQAEQNVRRSLQIADGMAPVILFIDELEKGLSGASGSGQNDSGVSSKFLGIVVRSLPGTPFRIQESIMSQSPGKCLRCEGNMEEGFFRDQGPSRLAPSAWVKGEPEASFRTGTKVSGKEQLRIQAFRCEKWGRLEFCANEPS